MVGWRLEVPVSVARVGIPSSWNVVQAADTEAWLKAREQYLTASDVSAVLGCNPHKSRNSVLKAKRAALAGEEARGFSSSAMWAGQFLEEGVLRWFLYDRTKEALALGESEPVGGVLRSPEGVSLLVAHPDPTLRLAASPDGLVEYGDLTRHLVEVKVCGPEGSWLKWALPCTSKAWAEMGRSAEGLGCPVPHYIQLQVQLLCTGESFGWVVGNCGTARRDHPFGRDEELHERIVRATREFWLEVLS